MSRQTFELVIARPGSNLISIPPRFANNIGDHPPTTEVEALQGAAARIGLKANNALKSTEMRIFQKIDFSNEVIHGLQLDDYDIENKFESLKRIMHSGCR